MLRLTLLACDILPLPSFPKGVHEPLKAWGNGGGFF